MDKITGVAVVVAFIVLASECEFTLMAIIAKTVALAVLSLATVLASRKPEVVPARRRK